MNSWVKDSQPASLSPAAVVVALERDLLLSSLSRPIGTPPPIAPGAVPATCGPSVRAAAEAVTLVRRGEYVAALRLAPARALLGADDDPPRASDDARAASTASGAPPPPLYPGVAAAVARAVAAASDAGDAVELAALELLALACGVAALAAFHQANVTGPPPLAAPRCPLASESAADDEPPPTAAAPDDDPIAIRSLSLDGEDVVGRCLLPRYLALARVLLVDRAAPAAENLVRSVNPESPSLVPLAEARGAAPRRVASAGRAVLWPSATLPSGDGGRQSLPRPRPRAALAGVVGGARGPDAPARPERPERDAQGPRPGPPRHLPGVARAGEPRGAELERRGGGGGGDRVGEPARGGARRARVRPRGQRRGAREGGGGRRGAEARDRGEDGVQDGTPDGREGADGPRGDAREGGRVRDGAN